VTGLIGALVSAPLSLALKAGPYFALVAVSLMAWHFDARAVANVEMIRAQAAAFKQAQATATQIAQTTLQHKQAAYQVKAMETNSAYRAQLVDAKSAADRYSATHRVQPQAVPSGRRSALAAAQGRSTSVPAIMPADAVVVSSGDLQACTDATTYALNAHSWATAINP
jgi:hypothetical protein